MDDRSSSEREIRSGQLAKVDQIQQVLQAWKSGGDSHENRAGHGTVQG